MLKYMRKYAKSYLIKVLFAIIIIVFVFYFGAGSLHEKENLVAEVGPFEISYSEYWEAYSRELELYRQIYRDRLDDTLLRGLKEKVLDDMINQYVLLAEAKKLGISVSDMELADHLARIDAFRRDGVFDKDQYLAILRQNNIEPKQYEDSQRMMLLLSKTVSIIKDTGVTLTDAEVRAGYASEKGKVSLAYTRFAPSAFKDKVTVSDAEISEIYEREKERYRGENTYRLKYIVIDAKTGLKDDVVYMDLLKVKDIDSYAVQKRLSVTDTGFMRESEVLERFKRLKIETWLKDLRQGEVSLPLRDDERSYIFQLVGREEGKPMERSAAFAVIKDRIASERAGEMARRAAEEAVGSQVAGRGTRTGFVPRTSSTVPGLGEISQSDRGIFELSKEQPVYKAPVEIGGNYYIFSFVDEQHPDKQQWEKDREEFSRYFAVKRSEELVMSFIHQARENALSKGKLKILKGPQEL